MIGDQDDIYYRLKSYLPGSWFSQISQEQTPILYPILQGFAWCGAFVYSLYSYVKLQTRIKTATDDNLDLIAKDFYGNKLKRRLNENDDSFRARILASLFQEKATRRGMIRVLTLLTGRVPVVIEGHNPSDIGAYDVSFFYDVGPGYGGIFPYQCWINVFRPQPTGLVGINGYDCGFGYDFVDGNAYVDVSSAQLIVSDQDILNAIDDTKPAATLIHTQILN